MRQLSGKPLPPLHPAVAVDGSPLVTVDSQLSRWKEHFKALHNRPPPTSTAMVNQHQTLVEIPYCKHLPPDLEESLIGPRKLKLGKAQGVTTEGPLV